MDKFIHQKRKHGKGKKGGNKGFDPQQQQGQQDKPFRLPRGFEVVFKWVSVDAERVSPRENKEVIYQEYVANRAQLLKDTVYNPDGTENVEGISRLRQAGLDDKAIFETVAKGRTPNGFNYHHLFPRALSGSFKRGPVEIGGEMISSIHDWRCLQPLSNAHDCDIHGNVHKAMEERNGHLPSVGHRTTYDIAIPLTAKEYELYRTNPKAVKAELLIVGADSYRTVDQRGKGGELAKIVPIRSEGSRNDGSNGGSLRSAAIIARMRRSR